MASGNWWDKLKQNVGLNAPEEEPQSNTLLQHLDEVSTLNRTQVKQLLCYLCRTTTGKTPKPFFDWSVKVTCLKCFQTSASRSAKADCLLVACTTENGLNALYLLEYKSEYI